MDEVEFVAWVTKHATGTVDDAVGRKCTKCELYKLCGKDGEFWLAMGRFAACEIALEMMQRLNVIGVINDCEQT